MTLNFYAGKVRTQQNVKPQSMKTKTYFQGIFFDESKLHNLYFISNEGRPLIGIFSFCKKRKFSPFFGRGKQCFLHIKAREELRRFYNSRLPNKNICKNINIFNWAFHKTVWQTTFQIQYPSYILSMLNLYKRQLRTSIKYFQPITFRQFISNRVHLGNSTW